VKAKRIHLFIKSYCALCQRPERWLKERNIRYQAVDVISDEAGFKEMIALSGQELSPVIEVDGKMLADFDPKQLAEFSEREEDRDAHIVTR